jgi:hypothetical protein
LLSWKWKKRFANYYLNRRALRPGRNRRYWIKLWIYRREQFGQYDILMRELREEDPEVYINYMKSGLGSHTRITKQDTWWRKALDSGLKFACTMRHLASGND